MVSENSLQSERLLSQIRDVVLQTCHALGVGEVTRVSAIESARVDDGHLYVTWQVATEAAASIGKVVPRVEAALQSAMGMRDVTIVLTTHRTASGQAGTPRGGAGHRPFALAAGASDTEDDAASVVDRLGLVIAVASGKGGVGKSTTAVNLAVGLAQKGLKVGMLDADIYGPSLPRMLGHSHKPEVRDGKIIPVQAWGIEAMSIGFMVDEAQAMIWRGPMVMGAINQFINDVAWPDLDVTVVDLPPGTGDAQLSISQKLPLAGAVIVSTPQDIALLDARRGITMFEQLRVPVLGIIENMSYFCCPNCNHRTELFGHGGARKEAESRDIPFLGEIPLRADIRQSGDSGTPIIMAEPDGEAAYQYRKISEAVFARLSI